MKKKISYIKFIKLWGLVLLLLLGISIISIDVISTYHDFNIRIEKMRSDYIEQQKLMVKREADRFLESIRSERITCVRSAKEVIKSRISDAYGIAHNIYQQNKVDKTEAEIKKMIIDALRTIRFAKGTGYYFMYSLDGTKVLCTHEPQLEGKNYLDVTDADGKYFVKDMISIVERDGEGFYEFCAHKPSADGNDFKKISYIKLFEPYSWVIATGLYTDDIEEQVKKSFLEQVNETHYGINGYFIAGNWQGVTLAHGSQAELIGTDMWDVEDIKGTKLVQKLIAVAKSKNGGYVKYWWRKPDSREAQEKITFAVGLREWEYYLATGVYLDDIEPVIAIQQSALNDQVKTKLILFITFITVTIILFLILFNRVSVILDKDFSQFISFFKRAVHSNVPVDHEKIRFSEFDELANSANAMLQDKILVRRELRDEKEQLAVTLRSIGDGVITTDTVGRVELLNTVAENITGWSTQDAVGKMLSEVFRIIHEETREIVDNPVNQVLANGHIVEIANDSVLISRDGTEYYISDSAAPIKDTDSNIRGVVLVFRDVTAQKKSESALFNVKRLESIGILAGGIAHDFNNVLTGLFGNIELAKGKLSKSHSAYPYIETAEQALERATNLTKQLLTFAKGGVPILAAVSLQEVVTESVKFNLSGSNVKVDFNLPDNLWAVKADKGQLNQVMANLAINAKQAMPAGGCLYISAENIKDLCDTSDSDLTGDFVKLIIQDDGCGIKSKDLGKIFDPYFSTKQSGSGLGLATVHSIIVRHKGHIHVDSIPGEGTVFTILLPVEKDINEQVISTKINIPKNQETIFGNVLIMDDEAIIITISTEMLKACGYTSDYALDGTAALEKYLAAEKDGTPFDMVIMDLTIPGGMGGKDAIDKFLAVNPDVKVIVSSGYSVDPVLANYGDYGFKGRLIKPFKMHELARELAHVLQMS